MDKVKEIISKFIIIFVFLIIAIIVVIFAGFLYNNIRFSSTLKDNGYTTSNFSKFTKTDGNFTYNIEITKYNIFSRPEFLFTKQESFSNHIIITKAVIEFKDVENNNKNLVMTNYAPTNNKKKKKMTVEELNEQLKSPRESFIVNYAYVGNGENIEIESVDKEEWEKISKEYVDGIKEAYDEVINMFK